MTESYFDTILRNVDKLPEPANLFSGVQGTLTCLPQEVLLFLRKRQLQSEPRVHHRFVLIICLRESGGIVLDGQVFHLEERQGILIFPHQSHHFTRFAHPKQVRWLFITFEYQNAEELISLRYTPFTLNNQGWEQSYAALKSFQQWHNSDQKQLTDVNLQVAMLLNSLLKRQARYISKAGGKRDIPGPDHLILEKVCRYVHDHLGQDLRLETVATHVNMSASHLRARFRTAMGMSLGEFIRRTRIHRACGLLHSSGNNVTEIAEACGFKSLYSFSRAFKEKIGESPMNFRKGLLGETGG